MKNFVLAGDTLIGDDGTILHNIHSDHRCLGDSCVVHRPSDHHMREWPMYWVAPLGLFLRICEHGEGHPDPDQLPYVARVGEHVCDGCCKVARPKGFFRRLWEVLRG